MVRGLSAIILPVRNSAFRAAPKSRRRPHRRKIDDFRRDLPHNGSIIDMSISSNGCHISDDGGGDGNDNGDVNGDGRDDTVVCRQSSMMLISMRLMMMMTTVAQRRRMLLSMLETGRETYDMKVCGHGRRSKVHGPESPRSKVVGNLPSLTLISSSRTSSTSETQHRPMPFQRTRAPNFVPECPGKKRVSQKGAFLGRLIERGTSLEQQQAMAAHVVLRPQIPGETSQRRERQTDLRPETT